MREYQKYRGASTKPPPEKRNANRTVEPTQYFPPNSANINGCEDDTCSREPPLHEFLEQRYPQSSTALDSSSSSRAPRSTGSSAPPTSPTAVASLPCTAGVEGRENDTRPRQCTPAHRVCPRPSTPPQTTRSSAEPTSSTDAASWHPVNLESSQKCDTKKSKEPVVSRPYVPIAPAPPREEHPPIPQHIRPRLVPPSHYEKTFYGIPPEIRVEIYRLVLANVTLHILPRDAELRQRAPHPLTRVSRVVRNEVLPIIHSSCPIKAEITDFNFTGMLAFMARIPPQDQKALLKNNNLKIELCTASEKGKSFQKAVSDSQSLRTWLHARADKCRVQPRWEYCGSWPGRKVESDIRRRIKRMTEEGKRREMIELAKGIQLQRVEDLPRTG